MVRRRGGRKRALGMRAPIALPSAANERWSPDFVHDQMVDGWRFRSLTVVDDCTREWVALVADTISGLRVAREPTTARFTVRQIYARQGIEFDRSTLAHWVGRAAWLLTPVHDRLFEILKASPKLFADETTAPVLDPGRGRTKTGRLWAVARDDRPWGGTDPPGVVYIYAAGRSGDHAVAMMKGFAGILQVDGYAGYRSLADPGRGGQVTLAFCWARLRRRFYEMAKGGSAPIANEALARIAAL
jgi:hypothetical protein